MRALFSILIASLLLAVQSEAQLPNTTKEKSLKGSFYVSANQRCSIFLNGTKVHQGMGKTRSPDLELKVGDRILVRATNMAGPRHLLLAFASSDNKLTISFKARDYRIVPEVDVNDFALENFKSWKTPAELKKKPELPIKNNSEPVWGDLDQCILACIVTPQIFSHVPNPK